MCIPLAGSNHGPLPIAASRVQCSPVWSKNSEHVRRQDMMSAPDERKQVAAPARVRNRVGQSGIARPKRVLGCGESDFTCAAASVFALIRSREIHLGRNRQANGRKVLVQVACMAKPDTILAWYRK